MRGACKAPPPTVLIVSQNTPVQIGLSYSEIRLLHGSSWNKYFSEINPIEQDILYTGGHGRFVIVHVLADVTLTQLLLIESFHIEVQILTNTLLV